MCSTWGIYPSLCAVSGKNSAGVDGGRAGRMGVDGWCCVQFGSCAERGPWAKGRSGCLSAAVAFCGADGGRTAEAARGVDHGPPSFQNSADGRSGLCRCSFGNAMNYMGWENALTVAQEVAEPQKNYPRAMLVAAGLVAVTYICASGRGDGGDPGGEVFDRSVDGRGARCGGALVVLCVVLGGTSMYLGCSTH